MADWTKGAQQRAVEPATLPVCDWIAGLQAAAETQAVVAELQRVAAELAGRQTYGWRILALIFWRAFYLLIAGVAEWQKRTGEFAAVSVGQAIHHPSWIPHAMRVLNEPLAALYL